MADLANRHLQRGGDLLHDAGDDEFVRAHREGADDQRPHCHRHPRSAS
jgi:hypothetical protein